MYQKLQPGIAAAVVPSDTVNIPSVSGTNRNNGCVLYVGVSGDISVLTAGGQEVTLKSVPVGVLNIQVLRVNSTGTTATDIVALW